jgi:hypothetical protein
MLKTSRSATLLSIFIITSLSLTGCSWRQFKQFMGWCKRNCDDIPGSITPPKPVPTFSPRPRPTIQPRPVIISSPNPQLADQLGIRIAANTAALNHLLYKNDQATFTELKLVAEQEARKEAFRRGVIISGTGFSTIGTAAATYALNEKGATLLR